MEFLDLIRAIADFGILTVLSGLVVYGVYRWIRGELGRPSGKSYKLSSPAERKARKEHDDLLELRTTISTDIQQLITKAIKDNEWTRIHVVEFSNSVVSVAYLPFRYMTCTYEAYQLGEVSTGTKIDRLSTSLFTAFFTKLKENGYCMIDLAKPDDDVCGAMRDLMRSNNETKSLSAELVSPKGKSLGYISVKDERGFTEKDIAQIRCIANQVATLLAVVDK